MLLPPIYVADYFLIESLTPGHNVDNRCRYLVVFQRSGSWFPSAVVKWDYAPSKAGIALCYMWHDNSGISGREMYSSISSLMPQTLAHSVISDFLYLFFSS